MSRKQLVIELFMPVVFIGISLYFILGAISMGSEGTFPLICGVAQLACSVYLLIKTLARRELVVKLQGLNMKKALLTIIALIVYVLALEKIGYCIATFLLIAFTIWFLGYRKIPVLLLCAALTVAVTYVIFGILLSVPLPMLIFE